MSSVRPSSSACVYAAIVARTPSTTSANVIVLMLQNPMSTIGISSGFTLTAAQRREQLLVGQAGEEAVDGPFEVRDVALGPLGQAHVLEALRVQALVAGGAGSRSPARGSAATADRRSPTPRAAWAARPFGALREPGERPDLHQRLLRPQRAEAVRRGAAVHRQQEEVREAVAHRLVDPLRLELVEVGDVAALGPVPAHDRVVERALPGRHRQRRRRRAARCRAGPRRCARRSRAPSRPCRRSSRAGSGSPRRRTAAGRTRRRRAAGTARGCTSSGCVSITWYCSTNASCASFQFTGSRAAYHFSVRSDSTFQRVGIDANGSMHCRSGGASSSRLIHAQPPHTSHRTGVRLMSSGREVVLGERLALRDVTCSCRRGRSTTRGTGR